VHGEPILYAGGSKGVVRDAATGELSIVEVAAVGLDAILVHDAHREDPALAFSLSRLTGPGVVRIAPVGIFRAVDHPAYDDLARQQLAAAGPAADPEASLQALLRGAETWTVL
jgi:2-oxoglutarate ferredoxin oxidoreductase subunit beta